MNSERLELIVLVKAAPVLTSRLEETMCVAGIQTNAPRREWIRLHPVPFRDLNDDAKFTKYQRVSVDAIRPKGDRRPESWTPLEGSITLGEVLSSSDGWAARRPFIEALPEANMCDLIAANKSGSGPNTPSLAVVRPADPPTLSITRRDAAQIKKWEHRAAAVQARMSLFDSPGDEKAPFEVVPWRFRYKYRCGARTCSGHEQTIVDWEVLALWRNVRGEPDWEEKMRKKFEETLWFGRDSVLFVGNQNEYPVSFLVLGVFWPPAGPAQGVLEL